MNVGEHVRATFVVQPAGTPFSNPHWTVGGVHLNDWVTKDSEPRPMTVSDYLGQEIHFLWKDTTPLHNPNKLRVSALVGGTVVSHEVEFLVERQPKAEKFYSDDLLMENHNNWHSVYMFYTQSTRRGDLFLAWHRSQLSYFNAWRAFFGYPLLPTWNPTLPWATAGVVPAERQHPSSPAPKRGFSSRPATLVTLDLEQQQLETASLSEYDLVTETGGFGTLPEFATAGYVLRTETVRQLICGTNTSCLNNPTLARNGPATVPSWWQPASGQTAVDPWFAAGCPAQANPLDQTIVQTCAVQQKSALQNYSLREFGESIESGQYQADFRVNYHALGHIAASVDMSNPATSMRDPIFWGWHQHIDGLLTAWQATQGVEASGPTVIYGRPQFMNGWSTVRVAFSHRVIADAVRPENVLVNGQPAIAIQDVSLTGTGYIFSFSGFPVPADGDVELVVRREVNNTIRANASDPRPRPTLVVSTFGNLLEPIVSRYQYTKP